MKLKRKFNSLFLTIGFGSIIFLLIIIFFNFNSNFSVQNSLAKTGAPLVKAASVRFIIPKLKIDTILEKVGLTKQGAVAVPKKDSNAAWFDHGARPGELGTSLIVGHYGYWKNGTRGIFNNISKLVKGDKIYVENELGVRTTFIVSGSKLYSLKDDTSAIFNSGDDKAYLNLITCEGIWNPVSKSYPKRLVIFAEKEKAAKLTK